MLPIVLLKAKGRIDIADVLVLDEGVDIRSIGVGKDLLELDAVCVRDLASSKKPIATG